MKQQKVGRHIQNEFTRKTHKKMNSGYATDEKAGIFFKNGKAVEFVSQSDNHNSYYVSLENGQIKSKNDAYINSFGYGVWYFYNSNGIWKSMGEDIGGSTLY